MRAPLLPPTSSPCSAVGAVTLVTDRFLPVLGMASSALLFLLPVLYAAARGGVGPGLMAALAGAAAYNFFLLPPRYTFRIHGLDNLISVQVLVVVALVTSRLATAAEGARGRRAGTRQPERASWPNCPRCWPRRRRSQRWPRRRPL